MALSRALRDRGLQASVDQELALTRALEAIDLGDRGQVYWAAAACFLRSPEERPAFDLVFGRFWRGLGLDPAEGAPVQHGESDPRMPGPQHGGESLPQFRLEGRSGHLLDGGANRATQEIPAAGAQEPGRGRRRGALAAYSPDEAATDARELDYARDELAVIRRIGEELRRAHPERVSRRQRACRRRGRLDLRRTARGSLRSDGELIRPAWTARSRKPRRIVMLCDVSGSMERYSRVLLASMQAAITAGINAEAFVFATRLTRLTATMRDRDIGRALDQARSRVGDWSGGTRIGAALGEFNSVFGRLGLARGAVVIVVSDGWDRGSPDCLAREVRRLRLQARRLIWLNPRPGGLAMQPLAVGMQAALPHVDHYLPGADADAVVSLVPLLHGLGPGRPQRRAAVHSVADQSPYRAQGGGNGR